MRATRLILWLVLLVGPVLALVRLGRGVDPWIVAGAAIVINLLTYVAYAADKRRAQRGRWRIAENLLHALELLGGWPAALLAQWRVRHKSSKRGYRLVFWIIVFAHQYLAFAYIWPPASRRRHDRHAGKSPARFARFRATPEERVPS